MNKLSGYIASTVGGSILLVFLLVLGLDVIAAIVDQLGDLREAYTFIQAIYYVLLTIFTLMILELKFGHARQRNLVS